MLAALLFFLLLRGSEGESSAVTKTPSDRVCSYQDVLNHLKMNRSSDQWSMTRPMKDHKTPTKVNLEVVIHAILDVKETEQMFVPYVWIDMNWHNDYIFWKPKEFCQIRDITVPRDILWKPDLTILEMTENDKGPPTPYLIISNDGTVKLKNHQIFLSTCRMQVYKFPFDIQRCNLTFMSVSHTVKDIKLVSLATSETLEEMSRSMMPVQYEWLFISINVTNSTHEYLNKDQITYTITMRRKPLLYIINFLLPVFFLFCLDLASFLISEGGGEKLGFQVTVLLAITVMQLLLHEILPSSSNKIPLIALYCVGIFSLMMLSLMETIVVTYLMQKDNETNADPSSQSKASEEGSEAKEGDSGCVHRDLAGSEELPDQMVKELGTLKLLFKCAQKDRKPGYWTKMARTINRVFFVFYVITVCVFLLVLYFLWQYA